MKQFFLGIAVAVVALFGVAMLIPAEDQSSPIVGTPVTELGVSNEHYTNRKPVTDFEVEPFNSHLYVFIADFRKESIGGQFYWNGGDDPHIILRRGDFDEEILVHEISHFVDRLTVSRGVNDTETRAYLMGNIFKKIDQATKLCGN